jgi:hypothetical protein
MKRVQYVGYQPQTKMRTYTFRVIEALVETREIKVSINTDALWNSKFKDQDIPDLCFAKLKHDLSVETEEQPLPRQFTVSDLELRRYVEEHYPVKVRSPKSWQRSPA